MISWVDGQLVGGDHCLFRRECLDQDEDHGGRAKVLDRPLGGGVSLTGMPTLHAGDFDYDIHGHGYAQRRRPDPRSAALIHAALGDARTVVNVGAGAGSYEPADRYVVAVEPSAGMRAQRPATAVPALNATAESLPFDDGAFDAAMATRSCRPTGFGAHDE